MTETQQAVRHAPKVRKIKRPGTKWWLAACICGWRGKFHFVSDDAAQEAIRHTERPWL